MLFNAAATSGVDMSKYEAKQKERGKKICAVMCHCLITTKKSVQSHNESVKKCIDLQCKWTE